MLFKRELQRQTALTRQGWGVTSVRFHKPETPASVDGGGSVQQMTVSR